ncbi:cell wall metabolism sensor histidine kinase WalK [Trichocoleus sp. FACHB-262]|uniref:sensor histidine kinase n=1 Tax=Trichocoleus sp. FACHB-262 TaxID=2692869 RepID=UPI001681D8E4|nr:HAMP domain-containing sensor histidine kinase [Trichocoleus sp. FACHB-262]MBD2122119.1 HAMP domain-containing histidine kinase [Trichocoleus sp. FACHB-262]
MFQTTRRRLALWYTTVTAVLLLLFASGFYLYVRSTLIERIDDTLNHVVEVVQRSLVLEPVDFHKEGGPLRINIEASFRNNADTVEDDHIDLEWFSPEGDLLWSTLSAPLNVALHPNSTGETVHLPSQPSDRVQEPDLLRQVTQRVQVGRQVLGYLRVSHPWFEVTKPIRQLIFDLSLGTGLMVVAVAAIGWLLSGLAMQPVQASYQQLKQFTADASHELRNPIATIQTNVQVALSDPNPDPQWQQQQLKVVERLTRRLGRLVDDLLFLARQDSGMVQPRWTAVALDALLIDVVEEQQAIALEKGVSLSLDLEEPAENPPEHRPRNGSKGEIPPEPFTLQGDRDQLARLFTNLVGNAVQYTPVNGRVEVMLQQVKRNHIVQLQVQVRDTGIGIPLEALPHIFDRFYRVDPARTHENAETSIAKPATTGSGLGLAIAQAIVENHQGNIVVESKPEQGTTFIVALAGYNASIARV